MTDLSGWLAVSLLANLFLIYALFVVIAARRDG